MLLIKFPWSFYIFIYTESSYTACANKPKFQTSDMQNIFIDVSCFMILFLFFLLNNSSTNFHTYKFAEYLQKWCAYI